MRIQTNRRRSFTQAVFGALLIFLNILGSWRSARAENYSEICSDPFMGYTLSENLYRPIRLKFSYSDTDSKTKYCGFEGKTLIFTKPFHTFVFENNCIGSYNKLAKHINHAMGRDGPIANEVEVEVYSIYYYGVTFDNKKHNVQISGKSTALRLLKSYGMMTFPAGKNIIQAPISPQNIIGYTRTLDKNAEEKLSYVSCALIAE